MEPINFAETNKTLGAPVGMDNCVPLKVWTDGSLCLSCWRPTWRERFSILVFGRAWLWLWSGQTQPPVALEGRRTPFRRDPAPAKGS